MRSSTRPVRVAWILTLAVLGYYTWTASMGRTTHGFIAYYAAARLLTHGQLSAQVYDDRWFGSYVQQLTNPGVLEIFGPNTR